MWRCAKCNFLHTVSESPNRCSICQGNGFIQVVVGKRNGVARERSDNGGLRYGANSNGSRRQ